MKYLFLFEIQSNNKILGCIPVKTGMIIIAILNAIFGLNNFILAIANSDGKQDNTFYLYVILAFGFITPLILIYTAFRKDESSAWAATYFHTIYLYAITIITVALTIIFWCVGTFSGESGAFWTKVIIFNCIIILFLFYANYVFTLFYKVYDEIMDSMNVSPIEQNRENLVSA